MPIPVESHSITDWYFLFIGQFAIFTQLLSKRINTTLVNKELENHTAQDADENLQKMHLHGLAAAHGRRRTLRKLLSVPDQIRIEKSGKSCNLSLVEALSEERGMCLHRIISHSSYTALVHFL